MKKIVLAIAFIASLGYGYYFYNIENTKTIDATPLSSRTMIAQAETLEDVIIEGRTEQGISVLIDNPQCYDSIQVANESEALIKESNVAIKVINVQNVSNALFVNNNACMVSINQLYDGDTGTYTIPSLVTIANGNLVEKVTFSNGEEVNAFKSTGVVFNTPAISTMSDINE